MLESVAIRHVDGDDAHAAVEVGDRTSGWNENDDLPAVGRDRDLAPDRPPCSVNTRDLVRVVAAAYLRANI